MGLDWPSMGSSGPTFAWMGKSYPQGSQLECTTLSPWAKEKGRRTVNGGHEIYQKLKMKTEKQIQKRPIQKFEND